MKRENIFCVYVSFSCLLYYPRLHKTFLLVVENFVFSELPVVIFATDSLMASILWRRIDSLLWDAAMKSIEE